MRTRTLIMSIALAVLPLVSGSSLVQAQMENGTHGKKIFGYQDSATGVFHPLPAEVPDASTTAPTTGTLKVVLNITVKSAWPTGTTRILMCSSDFSVTALTAPSGATSYSEGSFRYATGSGTAFTCTMTIPYSWVIPTTAVSRSLVGSYEVSVENTAAAAGPPILRLNGGDVVSATTLPANGATTTYTFNVTI
jgi:hypothetical protein